MTFTITPTANGCTGTPITATVTVNPRPSSVISGNQTICAGAPQSNISIALTGMAPWSFTYSNGTSPVTVTGSSINPYTFTPPASPAIYTVTSLSDARCTAQTADRTGSATLSQLSYTITASAGANGSISPNGATNVNCGASQTYNITSNTGFAIQNVLVDGVSQGIVSNYTFNNVTATHTIAATFAAVSGCTPPTISTSITNVLCRSANTGAINVTTSGGTAPFTYAWTGPNSFTAATEDITGLATGSYSIVVTATGGCSASRTVTITQPAASINAAATAGTIQCSGGTTTLTVTASGGTGTIQYSLNGGAFQSGNTFTVNAGGSPYTVTVRDTNGCTATTNTVTVTQPTSTTPATPSVVTGQVYGLCGGGSFTYAVQTVSGATGYTWTVPTGFNITAGQGTGQIQVRVPSTFTREGTIGVSGTNSCATGTPYTFIVYAILSYPASSITGPGTVNSRQTNVQYSVPDAAGVTFTWTVPSKASIISGQGTNSIKVKFGTKSGKISVSIRNTCGTAPTISKQVTVAASKPVAENQLLATTTYFNVYPNPAQSNATAVFNAQKTGAKFEVVISNISGETLFTISGTAIVGKNMRQLDLSKFATGMYLVKLITEENIQIQKLFKQ